MTTLENTMIQGGGLTVSQMISEAAYKLVQLVEGLFRTR